jgi:hypothetical protein
LLPQSTVDGLVGSARKEARQAFLSKHGFQNEAEFEAAVARAREIEDAQKTETQKAIERAEAAEKAALEARNDAEKLRLENLRARLGRAKNVPEPLIEKLVGEDEDSINAEIEALLPYLKSEDPQNLGGGTNPVTPGGIPTTEAAWAESLAQSAVASRRSLGG